MSSIKTTLNDFRCKVKEEICRLLKDFYLEMNDDHPNFEEGEEYVLDRYNFAEDKLFVNVTIWNTYDEFASIFEQIGNELGQVALDNFHAHIAGIEYSAKGEKKHLNLEESDFNYKDLLKAFKDFGVKGAVVCESPNIEDDAKLLKDYYLSL